MGRAAPLIYVIEDDAEIRALLMDVLCEEGYRTLGCATADEAAYLISAEQPDLVVLDNHLELYAAGWGLLTRLRTSAATARIPIILISADAPFLRLWCGDLPTYGCYVIEKPFDLDDLLTTVYAAVGVAPAKVKLGEA